MNHISTPTTSFERRKFLVGTRKSQLALAQTELAISELRIRNPDVDYEIIPVSTSGDKILDIALSKFNDKGLFTKELEDKLYSKEVDFVVHSLKDVPSQMPNNLILGCIFNRISPNDVILMNKNQRGKTIDQLAPGSQIGSSAVRRVATLKRLYPHLNFVNIRGNLNTRLAKLDGTFQYKNGDQVTYDAIIVAEAGVRRLGWDARIDQIFSDLPYGVGQGALACECRQDDEQTLALLSSIHCEASALTSIAERSLMRTLDGGCSTPLAVRSLPHPGSNKKLRYIALTATVSSIDGKKQVQQSMATNLPFQLAGKRKLGEKKQGYQGPWTVIDEELTEDQQQQVNNPKNVFLGLTVQPMCHIARTRLVKAMQLGHELAEKIKGEGAQEILIEAKEIASKSGRVNAADFPQLLSSSS
ncbi:hypothetical protein Ciccas_007077 [Cichlidogyrus casuarinus]|uniref:hydroxymethylbilane synthase n=1 Tax=Cichlidogyrus casuarinus TaxID=1844966 RepID=A0ABD2Q577_9PLAT